MRETNELRIVGDALNRDVLLDLMLGRFVRISMDASAALREALYNGELAMLAPELAPGVVGRDTPLTPEEMRGVILRVAPDFIRRLIIVDMAVDGKPHRWIGLSPAEAKQLREALESTEDALRMKHC